MADDTDSFLSRWSRRKAGVRADVAAPTEATVGEVAQSLPLPLPLPTATALPTAEAVETVEARPGPASAAETQPPPPPTMADVALLTRDSDYTRYLGGNVNPEVKNAALKHLFTDPHFKVMDGLDTYIGDYNTPDPLPPGMLRQMVQSQLLGLFDDEVEAAPEPTPLTADPTPLAADENPDLQLQPDDGAGRHGAETGAGAHPGRPD